MFEKFCLKPRVTVSVEREVEEDIDRVNRPGFLNCLGMYIIFLFKFSRDLEHVCACVERQVNFERRWGKKSRCTRRKECLECS